MMRLSGIVQGVGFRAFVYGLACEMKLAGFVRNDGRDVLIEAEGQPELLEQFARRVVSECPRRARVDHVQTERVEPTGAAGFVIERSR
jgi:hydrogenase maturation protein HypF